MAKINPKLNLNKTPQVAENNSLIFAKNIRLLADGTIGRDAGISPLNLNYSSLGTKYSNKKADAERRIGQLRNELYHLGDVTDLYKVIVDAIVANYAEWDDNINNYPEELNPDFIYDRYGVDLSVPGYEYITSYAQLLVAFDNIERLGIPKINESVWTAYVNTLNNGHTTDASAIFKATNLNFNLYKDAVTSIESNQELSVLISRQEIESIDIGYFAYIYNLVVYFGPIFNEALSKAQDDAYKNTSIRRLELEAAIKQLEKEIASYNHYKDLFTWSSFNIVGLIPDNRDFYIFIYATLSDNSKKSFIIKYSEDTKQIDVCNCNWNYSGGVINGNVNVSLNGDTIINICEYLDDAIEIPFKSINLTDSDYTDNESIYTQAPEVPVANLKFINYYTNNIPAGVYQFFIRYKIRNNFYTKWFPVSSELFAGVVQLEAANQGQLKYYKETIDSDKSFVLQLDLSDNDDNNAVKYEEFQLGFLLSHDGSTVARKYKHYVCNNGVIIYFDYNTEYIEEIETTELLDNPYSISNVKNIAYFKNKLYIANYKENNTNIDFSSYAKNISLGFKVIDTQNTTGYKYKNFNATIRGYHSGNKLVSLVNGTTKTVADLVYDTIDNDAKQDLSNNSLETELLAVYGNDHIVVDYRSQLSDYFYSNVSRNSVYDTIVSILGRDVITTGRQAEPKRNEVLRAEFLHDTSISIDNNYNWKLNGTLYNTFQDCINAILGVDIRTGDILGANDKSLLSTDTSVPDLNVDVKTITIEYYYPHHYYVDGQYVSKTGVEYQIVINFDLSNIKLPKSGLAEYNIKSLVPYQTYKFYIHYGNKFNEFTNGHYVGTIDLDLNTNTALASNANYKSAILAHKAILPTFGDIDNPIQYPEGYDRCFFSIVKVKNNVAEIFNIEAETNYREYDGKKVYSGDCIELDTRLLTEITNIPVVSTVTKAKHEIIGNYHSSFDSTNIKFFGDVGRIALNTEDTISDFTTGLTFVKINFNINEQYAQLIKCTPYITGTTYNPEDTHNLNLTGYICDVSKLNRQAHTYVAANDVYKLSRYAQGVTTPDSKISLTEYTKNDFEQGVDSRPAFINFVNSLQTIKTIYSNYNLNFLSLQITPNKAVKTLTEERTVTDGNVQTKQYDRATYWLSIFQSLELSDIYKLESTFRDYIKPLFNLYNSNITSKTIFDNTIRSSILIGDEEKVNIYQFNGTDYYNVPTDKGIITNLAAVGETIIVHTRHSIYKFSGYNTITANGGEEVQVKEAEVFDTGIANVFGSEYGFAGLVHRNEALVTQDGYIFYDADAKVVYLYGDDIKITKLSDSIQKLFDYSDIENINFANDYYNDRIFFNILFTTGKFVTLTFHLNTKTFISLHDFDYDKSFNTKVGCYFIKNNQIYKIDNKTVGYSLLTADDNLYPYYTSTVDNNKCAIVDIIFNDGYELPKVLDSISYICNKIYSFASSWNRNVDIASYAELADTAKYAMKEINGNNVLILSPNAPSRPGAPAIYSPRHDAVLGEVSLTKRFMAEEYMNRAYPGYKLRIYTDCSATDLMQVDTPANTKSITDVQSYKLPRFNKGVWSLNYFRDILNANDLYGYLDQYDDGRSAASMKSDDNSLIYGKYFVARFIFNSSDNFKLENIIFNCKSYE